MQIGAMYLLSKSLGLGVEGSSEVGFILLGEANARAKRVSLVVLGGEQ